VETFAVKIIDQSTDQLTGRVVNGQFNRFRFGQRKGDFCGGIERCGVVLLYNN